MKQIYKEQKKSGFTKTKRPELFPVKEEHKNPCSYLAKNASKLNKKAAHL
jgi:hypothetical protein